MKYATIIIILILVAFFVFRSKEVVKQTPTYKPIPNQSIPLYQDPWCGLDSNQCKG